MTTKDLLHVITVPRIIYDEIKDALEYQEINGISSINDATVMRKFGFREAGAWIFENMQDYRIGFRAGFRPDDVPGDYPALVPQKKVMEQIA